MPFDGIDSRTANTLALIDGVLAFYGRGATWCGDKLHDGQGRRSLEGAIRHVRDAKGIRGDALPLEIHRTFAAAGVPWFTIKTFNSECRDFAKVKLLLASARASMIAAMQGRTFHSAELAAFCTLLSRSSLVLRVRQIQRKWRQFAPGYRRAVESQDPTVIAEANIALIRLLEEATRLANTITHYLGNQARRDFFRQLCDELYRISDSVTINERLLDVIDGPYRTETQDTVWTLLMRLGLADDPLCVCVPDRYRSLRGH